MTDFIIIIIVNYFIIIEVKAGGELERSLVVAVAVELREAYLGTLKRPLAKEDISDAPPVNLEGILTLS